MTKLFIFSDNIINKKDTIITIFVHNKKKINISFNIKIKPNGLTQDVNNIVFLLSFGCNSSAKLRSIYLSKMDLTCQIYFPNLLLLSIISCLPHIFLYNLEVNFSMEDVCKAKTVLVPYRKIQYVAIETPFFIIIILIIQVLLILSSGFPSHKN